MSELCVSVGYIGCRLQAAQRQLASCDGHLVVASERSSSRRIFARVHNFLSLPDGNLFEPESSLGLHGHDVLHWLLDDSDIIGGAVNCERWD